MPSGFALVDVDGCASTPAAASPAATAVPAVPASPRLGGALPRLPPSPQALEQKAITAAAPTIRPRYPPPACRFVRILDIAALGSTPHEAYLRRASSSMWIPRRSARIARIARRARSLLAAALALLLGPPVGCSSGGDGLRCAFSSRCPAGGEVHIDDRIGQGPRVSSSVPEFERMLVQRLLQRRPARELVRRRARTTVPQLPAGQWGTVCSPTGRGREQPRLRWGRWVSRATATSPTDANAFCTEFGCTVDTDCPEAGGARRSARRPTSRPTRLRTGRRSMCASRARIAPFRKLDHDCPAAAGGTQQHLTRQTHADNALLHRKLRERTPTATSMRRARTGRASRTPAQGASCQSDDDCPPLAGVPRHFHDGALPRMSVGPTATASLRSSSVRRRSATRRRRTRVPPTAGPRWPAETQAPWSATASAWRGCALRAPACASEAAASARRAARGRHRLFERLLPSAGRLLHGALLQRQVDADPLRHVVNANPAGCPAPGTERPLGPQRLRDDAVQPVRGLPRRPRLVDGRRPGSSRSSCWTANR